MTTRPQRPMDEHGRELADHMLCRGCGLWHKDVEAGGCWHCPNPTCPSPGAAYWRHKMPSYTEVSSHRHTVEPADVVAAGHARLEEQPGEELERAIRAGIAFWDGDKDAFDRNKARWIGITIPRPDEAQAPTRRRFARIAEELLEETRRG